MIIPNSVCLIGPEAFSGCKSLKHVVIPTIEPPLAQGVIGYDAFHGCENLESVLIPDNYNAIGSGAFMGCCNLKSFIAYKVAEDNTSLTITPPIGFIEDCAFLRCDNLETVVLPDLITSINTAAFAFCGKLEHITLPSILFRLGELAFKGCLKLSDVIFTDTIFEVGPDAFMKCPALKQIKCPNPGAFFNARLRKDIQIV